MRRTIEALRNDELSVNQAESQLKAASHALESMPYSLIKEIDNLLLQLEQEGHAEQDGFASNHQTIIEDFESKLLDVPVSG